MQTRSPVRPLLSPAATRLASRAALAIAVLGAPGAALAQPGDKGGAATLIQRGGELFEDQAYEESIQTLSAALLRPGTPKDQKIEVYRLLAYNYIALKRTEEADAAVRGLLVLDESFSLPPSESPRFRDFFAATRGKWEQEGKPGKVAGGDAPGAEPPVELKHASPAQVERGTAVKLSGSVTDPGGRVGGVELAYRTGTKGKFVTLPATLALDHYSATIPASAVKPPLVEYYLLATDKNGLPIASRGDAAAPLRVVVPEPSGGVLASPWFWVPVGVAVVGGAVLTAVLVSSSSGAESTSRVTVNVRE
jgi:hypothetical protein